jgi:hypothetical protein
MTRELYAILRGLRDVFLSSATKPFASKKDRVTVIRLNITGYL